MSDESGDESGDENTNFIGIFEGGRNDAGERHGDGNTILPNKDQFKGQYFNGLRQGLGLYQVMKKGQVVASYDGEWCKGLRDGSGTCVYADGSKYTGFWENDKRQGRGTLEFANGQVYKGGWKEGLREDECGFLKFDGGCHIGGWKSGVMNGPGMILYEPPAPSVGLITSWDANKVKGPGFIIRERYFLKGNFLPNEEWRISSHHPILALEENLRDTAFEPMLDMLLTASDLANGSLQVNSKVIAEDRGKTANKKFSNMKELANVYLAAKDWLAKTRKSSAHT